MKNTSNRVLPTAQCTFRWVMKLLYNRKVYCAAELMSRVNHKVHCAAISPFTLRRVIQNGLEILLYAQHPYKYNIVANYIICWRIAKNKRLSLLSELATVKVC